MVIKTRAVAFTGCLVACRLVLAHDAFAGIGDCFAVIVERQGVIRTTRLVAGRIIRELVIKIRAVAGICVFVAGATVTFVRGAENVCCHYAVAAHKRQGGIRTTRLGAGRIIRELAIERRAVACTVIAGAAVAVDRSTGITRIDAVVRKRIVAVRTTRLIAGRIIRELAVERRAVARTVTAGTAVAIDAGAGIRTTDTRP